MRFGWGPTDGAAGMQKNLALVKTWMGDPTPQRGGRSKRLVRITSKGIQAASEFYSAVVRVSRGVSWETSQAANRQ